MGPDDANKVLMVTAGLLRPGKHQYLIKSLENSRSKAKAYIATPRIEASLPALSEKFLSLTKRAAMTKEKSVFRDFKEDTSSY